jgi:hypothetical protein
LLAAACAAIFRRVGAAALIAETTRIRVGVCAAYRIVAAWAPGVRA